VIQAIFQVAQRWMNFLGAGISDSDFKCKTTAENRIFDLMCASAGH
jgi:hypothetical protein